MTVAGAMHWWTTGRRKASVCLSSGSGSGLHSIATLNKSGPQFIDVASETLVSGGYLLSTLFCKQTRRDGVLVKHETLDVMWS